MLTKQPVFYVMGANTDLGKTLFSAGIVGAALQKEVKTLYIKPVQTGYPMDCDALFVQNYNSETHCALLHTKTLFSFEKPVSPHRARETWNVDAAYVSDDNIVSALEHEIKLTKSSFVLIEGAGGVASPTPSGDLQYHLYRKLRCPVVFVADAKLGGISASISSISLLEINGFDISCILLFAGEHENAEFLKQYYINKYPVFVLSNIIDGKLKDWSNSNSNKFDTVFQHLSNYHFEKQEQVVKYIDIAKKHIWWPFTQHGIHKNPRYIDSAFNDSFTLVDLQNVNKVTEIESKQIYDASASWWTQGIGHASPQLALVAGIAAGRYGHIMFPKNVHEPAAKLAEKLIHTVGKGWARRVFFSDNGSTAVEVALKMAFRKSFGSSKAQTSNKKNMLFVLGLKDSYHGDTLGSMNATSPNVYKNNDHWYEPLGYWLDYPSVSLKEGQYIVSLSDDFLTKNLDKKYNLNIYKTHASSTEELFCEERLDSELAQIYLNYISKHLKNIENLPNNIGALLLEPIILGAGGMRFVDPLFQKILVTECQKKKIPVILDEVFTAFWRLGKITAAQFLNIKPDIACYSKLLTGGLLPMSVTLSTEEVFQNFLGDSYAQALLHGHSYTASPIGCAVSLEALVEVQRSKNFDKETSTLKDFWNKELVEKISFLPFVTRVFALGSIFCLEVKEIESKLAVQDLVNYLYQFDIDARPLGQVIYILAGFNSTKESLDNILRYILSVLERL